MGQALAERMVADGIERASVLYEGNEYGAGWANMIDSSFRALGGTSTGLTAFSPEATSVDADLRRAFGSNEQAVVLVARARTGAAVVEEWASLGLGKRWYFVPALHDQVFLDNIPPGVVDDMVGISPALGDDSAAFETLFSDRWDGDRPLAPGYFYFDAILLWALASEAARTGSADPTGAQVAQKLLEVSSPPGTAYTWQELPQALAAVRNGEDIDFIGTTGAVNFDSRGDVEASGNRFWHVDSDIFIEE
ncbi:MAG: ABC transporter substrate-binding protein [Deltaproteobacteria bacterium]|nr:ABC transporter substrate-binding protein [Deltaproteobacteria bacterium]